MQVILKVDDFWCYEHFEVFFSKILKNNIKINLGVIGSGVSKLSKADVNAIKNFSHLIEPFNHSWQHLINQKQKEYFNTDYEYQRSSIISTQEAISDILGHNCKVIGFPANASDSTTINILSELTQIDKVFYVDGSHNYKDLEAIKTIIPINGYGIMERAGQIDFKLFSEDLVKLQGAKTATFQLHPSTWTKESLNNFMMCCNLLLTNGDKFIFASEYEK